MSVLSQRRRAIIPSDGRSVIDEGISGANAFWKLYSDGTLEISGSGNWTLFDDWNNEYNEIVNSIVFKNINTTALSSTIRNTLNLFTNCKDLYVDTSFTGVFGANYPLGIPFENLHYSGTLSQWCNNVDGYRTNTPLSKNSYDLYINGDLLQGEVVLPNDSITLKWGTFRQVKNITKITINEGLTEIPYAFADRCTDLITVDLPNSLETIGSNAFQYCNNFSYVTIPQNCKNLENGDVFYADKSLTNVIFLGTPTILSTRFFNQCTQNNLNIYVPWAEGAVAGAPWGATNATIHYNTQYDANGEPITEG